MSETPALFPVTTVGSWPRPTELLKAQKELRNGRIDEDEFQRVADRAVLELLRIQSEAGVDVVTDGEQRRDNFYSFVAHKLEGVKLMTLLEMLDVIEDKAGFERLLRTLDVPAFSISNPTCEARISRRRPIAADELKFVRQHTDKPVKVTLPGPYLLTRAMWVKEVSQSVYPTKEYLAEDVVKVLRAELADLQALGANFVQFDEPVLTELVFTQGQTRTFMCAALAARNDPAEELEFAVALINRVVEGFEEMRVGLHICRGNWSRNESTLLRGSYRPLAPYLKRLKVRQLVLEYATERAGELMPFVGKELGLGVVNPRTDEIESVDSIVASAMEALQFFAPQDIYLNPDCGFCTFANRPMNAGDVAEAKMRRISEAAAKLREEISR